MTLSISNIAWDIDQEPQVFALLQDCGVTAIDVAPTKYLSGITTVSNKQLSELKQRLNDNGFSAVGMQSLLFGTQGLNLFLGETIQQAMLDHLAAMCRVGAALSAGKLVFGSPRNRDKSVLDDADVLPYAIDFFIRLGDIAEQHNVVICLEPNPTCYQSNFMVDSLETLAVVDAVNHTNIKMQLDVGAMQINAETPDTVISHCHNAIGHIHISQPQLQPVTDNLDYHQAVATALQRYLPDLPITIEMLTDAENPATRLQQIEDSVRFVQSAYEVVL